MNLTITNKEIRKQTTNTNISVFTVLWFVVWLYSLRQIYKNSTLNILPEEQRMETSKSDSGPFRNCSTYESKLTYFGYCSIVKDTKISGSVSTRGASDQWTLFNRSIWSGSRNFRSFCDLIWKKFIFYIYTK